MSSVDLDDLVEKICALDLCSAAALVEKIEEKLGFPKGGLMASVSAAGSASQGAGGAAEAEKTEFIVMFDGYAADKKIAVIKAVRECTSLGLKEAKDFVEQEGSRELIEGKKYKKAEAEEVKKKLEDAGAQVSLK
ncbi:50S ribosomal protein L7/L12 [Anaplasma phagocytophilum]|uniref:Large ribosomal subunit protein bL12 n=9 Tax=Anaplasma phagocytophilum TaxID=948 RepID=RL7_ANAPZ|nr:50S ribosomal protein L7/L12 [Anaplasma phagocytophilum]Q2GJ67.1 RecName: Full=Large ribosomal subunit protein bL12; AltName: Full=50S ribosomal protein L7/L12 [Anaplasma phagocytophilum str. HZ]KJV63793.1 ribosomal protein L7/L12 [Anaplasma phagocytophilum str. ApMUC09]KJZ98604.1 ribosomal protein L7/L12 [Anaplasma phagocytophilum str. CR1007]ABD44138.1 ribosomal protein L7/L12 [Anaplasma phagocytophilum str. HZ]AGR78988.1 50S ribosomal protein L7 [Anaplasma phagocytophilum str. HZ2]AGR80